MYAYKLILQKFHESMMTELRVLELFSGIGGMHYAVNIANQFLQNVKLQVACTCSNFE